MSVPRPTTAGSPLKPATVVVVVVVVVVIEEIMQFGHEQLDVSIHHQRE
ncbi:MAG: hypothetical protein JRK53_28610 [Deltaproteobacteria bacterium]|nr:hypothetical protein [Deltaproteobacteria bacterium]